MVTGLSPGLGFRRRSDPGGNRGFKLRAVGELHAVAQETKTGVSAKSVGRAGRAGLYWQRKRVGRDRSEPTWWCSVGKRSRCESRCLGSLRAKPPSCFLSSALRALHELAGTAGGLFDMTIDECLLLLNRFN